MEKLTFQWGVVVWFDKCSERENGAALEHLGGPLPRFGESREGDI